GEPADLVSYRSKSFKSKIRSFLQIRRTMLSIYEGFGGACINTSDGHDIIDCTTGNYQDCAFVADAIIATLPCYAHIHCAQRLGIPLHMMATTSGAPTREIPHPDAIWVCYVDSSLMNLLSYHIAEWT